MNSTLSLSRLTATLPKVGLPKISVRYASYPKGSKKPRPDPKSIKPKTPPPLFDPSYGEWIYAWQHTRAGHVIYSHTRVIKANKALAQIPFNGKKLRPTTIRKDYWTQLAVLQFPEGSGEIGRSVFQKLREFRRRHELEWEDPEIKAMDKKQRGVALNNQKANSIADIAAVLAGGGRGNKIWKTRVIETLMKYREGKKAAAVAAGEAKSKMQDEGPIGTPTRKEHAPDYRYRHPATVYWANEVDPAFSPTWTRNVKHVLGLPEGKAGPMEVEDEPDAALAQANEQPMKQTQAKPTF